LKLSFFIFCRFVSGKIFYRFPKHIISPDCFEKAKKGMVIQGETKEQIAKWRIENGSKKMDGILI